MNSEKKKIKPGDREPRPEPEVSSVLREASPQQRTGCGYKEGDLDGHAGWKERGISAAIQEWTIGH